MTDPEPKQQLTSEERGAALEHLDCPENFTEAQIEELKTQLDINPWLRIPENLANFNDFWDDIWCIDAENFLE
ncbi:hypothetical protein HZA41_00130 [Candidatus Peregrinibacteria bacterium]|nr:hypothetical protein [Candidatus Peregrinibacteria bacterium]